MDDDGRSGRWMAGGNVGKLTHLEAFTSEDAKRGRVWQDETDDFRRVCNRLERRYRKGGRGWEQSDVQVASFDGVVTWADEPKTLTPAEALRALADDIPLFWDKWVVRLINGEVRRKKPWWTDTQYEPWELSEFSDFITLDSFLAESGQVVLADGVVGRRPDPSQPAEPTKRDDDMMKRPPGCECHLEVGDSPCRVHGENEAKPQPGRSSCSCMGDASCPCRRRIVEDK